MSTRAKLTSVAAAVPLVAVTGCAEVSAVAENSESARPRSSLAGHETVFSEGLDALPSETLTDWVSYADAVVVVRVSTETSGKLTSDEEQAGEGLELRYVDLDILATLWTGPRGLTPDSQITVSPNAWVVSAGEKDRLLVFAEASRMEVGREYLVPLVHDDAFDPAWQALAITSVLPFDGGVVGQGEVLLDETGATVLPEELSNAAQSLWRAGREDVIRLLESPPPDATAKELSSLAPTDRFREVQKAAGPEE
ncbi:hypothetical protein [Microbacterium sp. TNHR37B]|uniref:hypothetical protein n=1 Tax=Microbacterium sp. TNHR37B TaxID=1775956 RepID=UPI0007B1E477|nr:hypothetical protein [Microbacterium sp. TNHR37B]KZE90944.1 hypothetical protein AVP41_00471 [Microbacterium sp. TNHR37B]